jgi:hypothetical protein
VRVLSLILALWIPLAAQAPLLNLVVVEGDGAVNNIRQRTAREPVVQVEDENHKPVAGAVVVFMLPSNGAGGTFANGAKTLTMTTDSKGQAVGRGLKPNGVKGQYQIRVNASHNGQTASVSITQTNAILSATGTTASSSAISGKLIAVLAVVGAAAAGGAYYATHNGGGTNPVPAVPGTTIAAGTGTVGPPR